MSQAAFLKTFEKHLRVAEPKRSEIIAELKTHCTEGADNVVLGDPKKLANQYNRTHIGVLYTQLRLHALPVSIILLLTLHQGLTFWIFSRQQWPSVPNGVEAFQFWISLGIPFSASFFAGRALIRTHTGVRDLIGMIVVALTAATLMGTLVHILQGPGGFYEPTTLTEMFSASMWNAGLLTFFCLALASFGMFIGAPLYGKRTLRLSQLKAQLWASALFAIFVGFVAIMGTHGTQSWDDLLVLIPSFSVVALLAKYWIVRWTRAHQLEKEINES